MQLTTVALIAALSAVEVVAGPTHAHLHRHKLQKKNADVDWSALDWDSMGLDWAAIVASAQAQSSAAATPTPTPTPTLAPAIHAQIVSSSSAVASSSATDIASAVESGVAELFEGLVGLSNDLTSFGSQTAASGTEIGKSGNIGNPQGSNIIKVDSADEYEYTNNFINTSDEDMTVVIWNKAFDDNSVLLPNGGSAKAPTTPMLTLALAPKENQIVAFQEDSQVGWAQATTSKTASSAFDTTWGEANFVSGGGGYDMSAIMNSAGNVYDMAISSTQTDCISDMTQNYWYAVDGDETKPKPVGGSDGSCYVPSGNGATLTTKMGGVKS